MNMEAAVLIGGAAGIVLGWALRSITSDLHRSRLDLDALHDVFGPEVVEPPSNVVPVEFNRTDSGPRIA